MDKIAVIKTGWSEDYAGSEVEADHRHVRKFKDGSEKFNFLPGPDGRYYAYTPPIGETYAPPKPKELDGWLVFAIAKKPKQKGLYLTGWYEDASFTGAFVDRPEYAAPGPAFPLDEHGKAYHYVLSAPRAVRIDPRVNRHMFAGDHMKRASIFYLRGNGAKKKWCAAVARQLLAIRHDWNQGNGPEQSPIDGSGRGGVCADAKRRREVEQAAIAFVKAHYAGRAYEIEDRQKLNCGFDLLVRSKKSGDELHVEVKGTQNIAPHFLMSHKEYAYMLAHPRRWRLAMVTEALSAAPRLELFDRAEARERFSWKEFTWHASSK